MHVYTLEEARSIVMRCAKQYEKNLLGKSYFIIYRDREDNQVKDLEVHLFFHKCLRNGLKKNEIQFKKDGTTNLKLAALPVIMQIQKVTKIAGDYNGMRPYLVADKLIGNVNFCLGLKRINKSGCYVPSSSLLEDIKSLTDKPSQVLAIFSKEDKEDRYINVRHVAKGLDLNQLKLPSEISDKISLEMYVSKTNKTAS